jgi:hypothetical protein
MYSWLVGIVLKGLSLLLTISSKMTFHHAHDRDRHVREMICVTLCPVEASAEPHGAPQLLRGPHLTYQAPPALDLLPRFPPTNFGGTYSNTITNNNHGHNITDSFHFINSPQFIHGSPQFYTPTIPNHPYVDTRATTGLQDPGQPSMLTAANYLGYIYTGNPSQGTHTRPQDSQLPPLECMQSRGHWPHPSEGEGKADKS